MAVIDKEMQPVKEFDDWYEDMRLDRDSGCIESFTAGKVADRLWSRYQNYKREMDGRLHNYHILEKIADGEVISEKPDLPNISSGETAGLIRRTARNLVQNTPNVEILSAVDDDGIAGKIVRHVLLTKIIGSDQYSNDMQQNLFASTKSSLALGFDPVIPVLTRQADGSWFMKYDSIHYRDVFPEPGVKDVREAQHVFVRRYISKAEVAAIIKNKQHGWDERALRMLLKNPVSSRESQSVSHADKKHKMVPDGYEVITWYSSTGEHFLTFSANTKALLRIEKNKHPLGLHPVFFLILEKDAQQPLGKSQVELLVGRQDFQDLMLNGAMKLWYRNINPSIIGYGTTNAVPNLSPGKYTQISNPNAKIEAFEVNTQTLLQYGQISQANMGSMVNLLGSADQAMATGQGGMGATPQGVEAQTQMVDITTNNYQKAIEGFFSHYCSYALSVYFAELKTIKQITLSAEARAAVLKLGLKPESIGADNKLDIDFSELQHQYFVRCVPGSLTEMEDEKQLRVLNELFVPLSQAMPALANSGDQAMIQQAAQAMSYIIKKQIELSGAADAMAIAEIWSGQKPAVDERDARIATLEARVNDPDFEEEREATVEAMTGLRADMDLMKEALGEILSRVGGSPAPSADESNNPGGVPVDAPAGPPTVVPASA